MKTFNRIGQAFVLVTTAIEDGIKLRWYDRMRPTRKHFWLIFWMGWWFSSCMRSLIEDFYGKESFMRMCQDGWVSGWITVPLALFGIMVVAFVLTMIIRKFPHDKKERSFYAGFPREEKTNVK